MPPPPGAADIGLIVYNTHWSTPGISHALVERLAELKMVVGLKWSTPETGFMAFEGIVADYSDRFNIIDNQAPVPPPATCLARAGSRSTSATSGRSGG